jgi:hypothetical protein
LKEGLGVALTLSSSVIPRFTFDVADEDEKVLKYGRIHGELKCILPKWEKNKARAEHSEEGEQDCPTLPAKRHTPTSTMAPCRKPKA